MFSPGKFDFISVKLDYLHFHTIIIYQHLLGSQFKGLKTSSTEAKLFTMQTHFKISCGSRMGGLRILQGAVRERNAGFKWEYKSMAGLEELEMVTARGM